MQCSMMSSNEELKQTTTTLFTSILKDFKVDIYDSKYSSFFILEAPNKQSVNGSWWGHTFFSSEISYGHNVSRLNCPDLCVCLFIFVLEIKQDF